MLVSEVDDFDFVALVSIKLKARESGTSSLRSRDDVDLEDPPSSSPAIKHPMPPLDLFLLLRFVLAILMTASQRHQ